MPELSDEDLTERARLIFEQSANVKLATAASDGPARLAEMARIAAGALKAGGKIIFCGNGGSAADAQHLAAELVVRLRADRDRDGLGAMTLAMDTSTLTACANDYSFQHVFERPLRAIGRKGDVLVGITTSGNSQNVVQAMLAAREMGLAVLGFLGGTGGKALSLCDVSFIPPRTTDTGRIQESHITAGHALVEMIEDLLGLGT